MKEKWRQIDGYPNYYVSNLGRVRSKIPLKDKRRGTFGSFKETFLRFNIIKGYHHVTLYNENTVKIFRVHRLVLSSFKPNPLNKPDVNHKSGVKSDNRLINLEWCNASENAFHAYKNKLRKPPKYPGCYDKPVMVIKDTAIIEFKSRRDCSRGLCIPSGSISRLVDSGREYNGCLIYSI